MKKRVFLAILFLSTFVFAPSVSAACLVGFPSGETVKPGQHIYVRVSELSCGNALITRWYQVRIRNSSGNLINGCQQTSSNGSPCVWDIDITAPTSQGDYFVEISNDSCSLSPGTLQCSRKFTVDINAPLQERPGTTTYDMCQSNPTCIACQGSGQTWTALGCLHTNNPTSFIAQLFQVALSIAGGIAVLLIIFGAFQIILASGNPEKIQQGKQIITSALTGVLFIIFSLFLLRLIGRDILKITNFGT